MLYTQKQWSMNHSISNLIKYDNLENDICIFFVVSSQSELNGKMKRFWTESQNLKQISQEWRPNIIKKCCQQNTLTVANITEVIFYVQLDLIKIFIQVEIM